MHDSDAQRGALRLGVLSQWYDPEPGGAAIPAALARELVARGHEVVALTGVPNYPTGKIYPGHAIHARTTSVDAGVHLTRVALYPDHSGSLAGRVANYGSFAATSSTLGLSALRGLDALWVYNSPATIALPMWASRYLLGVPHVLHVMDLWPDSILETAFRAAAGSKVLEKGLEAWCSGMYRSASSVAYITPGVGEALRVRGVAESKLHHVPVWADGVATRASSPMDRRALGIAEDEVLVLYAGTLGEAQGLDLLLDALKRLDGRVRLHCVVAGTGTAEHSLRGRATNLGLTNVTFMGQLPRSEMPGLMTAADVHVVMLRDTPLSRITMPSKIQTTLASGKPFLAAVAGDPARVARESGAAFLATPGDVEGVAEALKCAAAAGRTGLRNMGSVGRVYYQSHFAMATGVDAIERLMIEAARNRPTRAGRGKRRRADGDHFLGRD